MDKEGRHLAAQVGSCQGRRLGLVLARIRIIHHARRTKDESLVITLINAGRAFDGIQHLFTKKFLANQRKKEIP